MLNQRFCVMLHGMPVPQDRSERAKRLRLLRRLADLSQTALGVASGYSGQHVRDVEAGRQPGSPVFWDAMASVLSEHLGCVVTPDMHTDGLELQGRLMATG